MKLSLPFIYWLLECVELEVDYCTDKKNYIVIFTNFRWRNWDSFKIVGEINTKW